MNMCNDCSAPKEAGCPHMTNTVTLPGYGRVYQSRLDNLNNRIPVSGDPKKGEPDYWIAQRDSKGKLKEVDQSPQ